jgi:hypothetical protein
MGEEIRATGSRACAPRLRAVPVRARRRLQAAAGLMFQSGMIARPLTVSSMIFN